jgi:CheY-like chemotaxis protein
MEACPTILVVDDDIDIRDSMCLVLQHSGYRTLSAANGAEAVRALSDGASVDLILLDMMMPVMDGWGFRNAQQDGPAFAKIPVVVLTGDGRASAKAEAIGAAGYLKKPLDLDDLLEVVARYTKML